MSKNFIQTYSGHALDVLHPDPQFISIGDIAHSLSLQCRFNGQCSQFYSVADHSVLIARLLPSELKAWGLMHDSAEAYLGDFVKPVKKMLPRIRKIEQNLLRIIADKYGLVWPMPDEIHEVDVRMLMSERRDLMKPPPFEWMTKGEPYPGIVEPMSPSEAEEAFLETAKRVL